MARLSLQVVNQAHLARLGVQVVNLVTSSLFVVIGGDGGVLETRKEFQKFLCKHAEFKVTNKEQRIPPKENLFDIKMLIQLRESPLPCLPWGLAQNMSHMQEYGGRFLEHQTQVVNSYKIF